MPKTELDPEIEAAIQRIRENTPQGVGQDLDTVIRALAERMSRVQGSASDRSAAVFISRPSGYVD